MSPRSSSRKGPYRKPRADLYTWMLAISLVAMIIACVLLYLETADYPDKPPWSGGPSVRADFAPPPAGSTVRLVRLAAPLPHGACSAQAT